MEQEGKLTTIFFLRHGEPINPKNLIKGAEPYKLSSLGKKQIRKQARILKDQRIARIFTSPVLRCQQTAQIVAEVLNKNAKPTGGIRLKTSTYLTEWLTSLTGQSEEGTRKSLGMEKFLATFEPQEKVLKRMKEFVKMVLEKYSGQKIIAVSHQGPIDLLLFSLQGKDTSRMPFNNLVTQLGEIVKVEFDSQMKILSLQRIQSDSC